jgi:hypothetical protein
MVTPDVLADESVDRRLHQGLRVLEPLPQPDRVPLRLEPAEELGLERLQLREWPGLEPLDEVWWDALGPAHQHVVEEVLDLTGNRIPADLGDRPGPGHRVPLGIPVGVRLGHVVVVASHRVVAGVRHRIVGPVRDVHAGEPAEVGDPLQLGRGEPQAVQPPVERLPRRPQVHLEWDERLGRDHRVGVLGLVLQVGAAVRAVLGNHLVLEQDDRPTPAAPDLGRPAGDGRPRPPVGPVQVLLEVPLDHLLIPAGAGHGRGVAAVRALQRPAAGVELDLRPALRTREQPAGRRGLGERRRLIHRFGVGDRGGLGHGGSE